MADATQSLIDHTRGKPKAAAELLPLIYDELKRLAARYMRDERRDHTLQPTALVHEAYMRLVDIDRIDWQGRTHFYAMAAKQMRRILIDHARRVRADKRGAGHKQVTLQSGLVHGQEATIDFLALEEALHKLGKRNPRRVQVVELRMIAGLSVKEVAHVMEISATTVKDEWRMARAWLWRELG